jgi:hypothetical protein
VSNSAPDAQLRSRDENPTYSSSPGVTPERPNQARKPSPSQAWSIPPRGQQYSSLVYVARAPPAFEKSAMAPKWKVWHHREGPGVRGRGKTTNACTTVEEWPFRGAYGMSVGFSPCGRFSLRDRVFFATSSVELQSSRKRGHSEDGFIRRGVVRFERSSLRLALRPTLLRRNLFDVQRSAILPRAPGSD